MVRAKKAESTGAEGRERQKDKRTAVKGGGAGGGEGARSERQKGEGAECMEIRSHAIQL